MLTVLVILVTSAYAALVIAALAVALVPVVPFGLAIFFLCKILEGFLERLAKFKEERDLDSEVKATGDELAMVLDEIEEERTGRVTK